MIKQMFRWQPMLCLGLTMAVGLATVQAAPKPLGANLPGDTLAVLTIPNVPEAKKAFFNDPLIRLFDDPSMKGYTEELKKMFEGRVVGGIEKRLGVNLSEYAELMNGQLTVALFVNLAEANMRPSVDLLVMMDSGDKGEQLKTKLAEVQQRLSAAGAPLKPVTVRNQSFFRLKPEGNTRRTPIGAPSEMLFGQVDSYLMMASSPRILERSLAAAGGGNVESLAAVSAFSRVAANRLKASYGYAWINFAEVYKLIEPQVRNMDRQFTQNQNMLIPKPSAVLKALGLEALESLSVNLKDVPEGSLLEFAMSIPKQKRTGLFEIFAFEDKDSLPMNEIGNEVVSFNRTRLNLAKVWEGLQTTVGQLSPPVTGFIELFLGGLGKDRDSSFDFRESFFGNLGDDIVTIGLAPKSDKLEDMASPPSLTLLGSKDPAELAEALVVASGLIPSGGNVLTEREFLGKTIYSFKLPAMGAAGQGRPGAGDAAEVGLFMVPTDKYLVFSMDEETVEQYVRGPSASQKPLRRLPGLAQATQVLGDEALTSFRYDNAEVIVQKLWKLARQNPEILKEGVGNVPMAPINPLEELGGVADFSKLPPFEQVAKYFHYSVGGGSSDSQYINYRWFRPTPPELR